MSPRQRGKEHQQNMKRNLMLQRGVGHVREEIIDRGGDWCPAITLQENDRQSVSVRTELSGSGALVPAGIVQLSEAAADSMQEGNTDSGELSKAIRDTNERNSLFFQEIEEWEAILGGHI